MPDRSQPVRAACITLCLMALVLSGCSAATLRDAQQHFSAGASAENSQTIESLRRYELGITELAGQQAETEYRLACEGADELIRTREKELHDTGLLGTARMLRVYANWRILALQGSEPDGGSGDGGCALDYAGVSTESRRIVQDFEAKAITLGARDEAMARAIPGFLDLERARTMARDGDWASANDRFCSAIRIQEEAARNAPSDHSVRPYLNLAQIQGIGSWSSAARRLSPERTLRNQRRVVILEFAGPAICDLQAYTDEHEPTGDGSVAQLLRAQLVKYGIDRADYDCSQPQQLPAKCPDEQDSQRPPALSSKRRRAASSTGRSPP